MREGTRAMHAALLALLLSLGGCPPRPPAGSGPAPRLAKPGAATAGGGERWGGLFPPYPGARKLCWQHVSGFSDGKALHIQWIGFATADAPERVSDFYARNTSGAAAERSSHGLTQLRGSKREVLSVMIAARQGYPTCEVKPAKSDRTVIIVSTATP
jgi:hypothetical protein